MYMYIHSYKSTQFLAISATNNLPLPCSEKGSTMSVLSWFVWVYRGIMNSTKEVVIRVMMGVLIFLGYCLLSLFMYAIMRRVMVPQKLHVKPVHLYFQ